MSCRNCGRRNNYGSDLCRRCQRERAIARRIKRQEPILPPSERLPVVAPGHVACIAYPRCRGIVAVSDERYERLKNLRCMWEICPTCRESVTKAKDRGEQ